MWKIQYEHPFKTGYAKNSHTQCARIFAAKVPAHFWLSCQKSKALVSSYKETVTGTGTALLGQIEGVFVKILIRLWAKQIARLQWLEFRSRSSSRRCFASQYSGPISIGSPELSPSMASACSFSSASCSAWMSRSRYCSTEIPSAPANARSLLSNSGWIVMLTVHLIHFTLYSMRRRILVAV